jgi:catechol 2,3-dioxygenase-like lactoylglutathione lyase family enzyme
LTIDCADPARLVTFWCEALGYLPAPPPEDHPTWNDWYRSVGVPDEELDLTGDGCDRIIDPAGDGPPIWFQTVPEPKAGKNRLHLDLYVSGGRSTPIAERRAAVEVRVAELSALGAQVVRRSEDPQHYFAVLADPEGNEFCLA